MIQTTETSNFTRNFTIKIKLLNVSDIKEGCLFTTVHNYNLFGNDCTIFIKSVNGRCYDIRTGMRHLIEDLELSVYAIKSIEG